MENITNYKISIIQKSVVRNYFEKAIIRTSEDKNHD